MTRLARWTAALALAAALGAPAQARDDRSDRGLPADRVIAAIRTAVAAHPGDVREVEVEREEGRLVVDVRIVEASGGERSVRVDADRNEIVRTRARR
jgi:uncharacterized membrane protein YkoI